MPQDPTPKQPKSIAWKIRTAVCCIGAVALLAAFATTFRIPSSKPPVPASSITVPVDYSLSKTEPQQTAATEEDPVVPEKTFAELVADADTHYAAKDFEAAGDSLAAAYDKINPRSQQAVAVLLKLGEVKMIAGESSEAATHYRNALSILERQYGPTDARLLPAITGLIAAYDDISSEDNDTDNQRVNALTMTDRFVAIVGSSPMPMISDSTADEAAAAKYIEEAQKRFAANADKLKAMTQQELNETEIPTCLCGEIEKSISTAVDEHGARSYVVALLMQKQAENGDEDPAAGEVDIGSVQTMLSITEAKFGPTDARLAPVLRRLVAMEDASGDHESAKVYLARLDRLNAQK